MPDQPQNTDNPTFPQRYWMTGVIISAALFFMLAVPFVLFLFGTYDPLYVPALLSLPVIPLIFIAGTIFCIVKKRWLSLVVAIILMPPAWVVTLLGAMADYPQQPAHRLGHALVISSGALSIWLFVTLALVGLKATKKGR